MTKTKFRVLFLLMMSLGAGGSAIAQLKVISPDTLKAGETLKNGWNDLQSKNGIYRLSLQYGDLILYKWGSKGTKKEEIREKNGKGTGSYRYVPDYGEIILWRTRNDEPGAAIAIMQTDGNFVLYNSQKQAVWNTKTHGPSNHNSYLVLQDDGNLVIYKPNGVAMWNTKTNGK